MPEIVKTRAPWRGRIRAGVVVAAAAVLLVTGSACSGGSDGASGVKATRSATPTPTPTPTVTITGGAAKVPFDSKVKLSVHDGTFTAVTVDGATGDLPGSISADGSAWTSSSLPMPKASYDVSAQVKDKAGKAFTKTLQVKVKDVPSTKALLFNVTPNDGETVGMGQPIAVSFLSPIVRQASVERRMKVIATTPGGSKVTGSWHWLGSQVVHWRPEHFWPTGTRVKLKMELTGVRAAKSLWGRKTYSESFTIGSSRLAEVSAKTHMMRVYKDGKLIGNWPTGTGQTKWPTYNGTYIVLNKSHTVQMDSCSAKITCDKKNPAYYNEKVHWATRITSSGTFVHAAPWDKVMGKANTSHGCIHLSNAHAISFYQTSTPGDVVIVTGSNRGPEARVSQGDPGLVDWNTSWATWKAGSALH
ncbi:MAG: L,D-transpeptidase family protein [Streptosporangiales bacterium]|nr:L,D-transpeptidase family protein [Streptosporangiales bacterium]